MHTIKPLDEDCIIKALEQYPAIFTLEEHSKIGGLGSAVEEILVQQMENRNIKFKKFGFPDMFAPVTGSREYLNKLYGIDAESVAEQITHVLGR